MQRDYMAHSREILPNVLLFVVLTIEKRGGPENRLVSTRASLNEALFFTGARPRLWMHYK
jgi:hypothetical protein